MSLLFSKVDHLVQPSREKQPLWLITITTAIIIDYLASRQMFPYDNFSGAIIFGLTIVAGAIKSYLSF